MIVFDGHEYENAADVPDIGSFRCDTVENDTEMSFSMTYITSDEM